MVFFHIVGVRTFNHTTALTHLKCNFTEVAASWIPRSRETPLTVRPLSRISLTASSLNSRSYFLRPFSSHITNLQSLILCQTFRYVHEIGGRSRSFPLFRFFETETEYLFRMEVESILFELFR